MFPESCSIARLGHEILAYLARCNLVEILNPLSLAQVLDEVRIEEPFNYLRLPNILESLERSMLFV